jgi:hypothetical protein
MSIGQGRRCRATRHLNGHQGSVKAQTKGTIEFEIDNLGRQLISVRWDDSFQMYVFPDEIELLDSAEVAKSQPITSLLRLLRDPNNDVD